MRTAFIAPGSARMWSNCARTLSETSSSVNSDEQSDPKRTVYSGNHLLTSAEWKHLVLTAFADIPDHVDIVRYDDIDFGDDAAQGDESDSSPLTSVSGTPEPKDGSSAGPLMQLASPTRPGNPKNQNVSDSESSASLESSESPLSALREQATPRKGKRSKVLEMTTDQSGSPKKHVSKKRRLSARATLAADTSDDSSDTHPNIVHRLKTKHRLSMDSDGSTDPQASSNDGDSAFLDTLEGASQATYAYSELEDNEESSPHDSNPVDWSASLVLRSQSPTAEELSDLSNGERFDVLMARHEEAMRRREVNETPRTANVELAKDQGEAEHAHPVEGIPVSAVEFGDGELGEEYLRFMSEDVFSHGLTDEKGAPASVDVPPTSKRPLDESAEEGETTVKRQRVLSPSPASDIGALITATSRSFVGLSGVGLPPDLVQQIIAIDSGLRDRQATDSDKDEENPIYEINDEDKDDEPESPAEVHQTKGPVMGHVRPPLRTRRRVSPERMLSSKPARKPSPPVHSQLTERDDKPVWIDAFSVAENGWVRFRIDCLKASNPFERDILESLLACRTDRPGENPPWLDRTDGQSSIAHLRYSETVKVLPLFRERSVLVTNVPQGPKKWGWNSWTARELGDLNTPIIVHEGSAHSVKPTVEITSTLQTVLNEGSKGATGWVLNALTLPMPDTTLQTPLFQ
ncbi:hypothetical protein ARMSODRAFT_983828 [Armillaria solidipes]|uniref:Uncharacterized protein n=1 Tax=Armillaria solidipes TaxID=1076256 RepID=A0A2H3ANX4_9AGAR|nr:hypothetical protein ARMSODRAFT_983828 [Armillaria solidipes]